MSSDEMPEEVKEEVDQVKVVNNDHDVDDHDDHRDDCEREGSDPPPLHPGRQLTLVFHLSSPPMPR